MYVCMYVYIVLANSSNFIIIIIIFTDKINISPP